MKYLCFSPILFDLILSDLNDRDSLTSTILLCVDYSYQIAFPSICSNF